MITKIAYFLIGAFVGTIFSMNMVFNNPEYRISFYGYEQRDGELFPIIKLRKIIHGDRTLFNIGDEGSPLEIGNITMKNTVIFDEEKMSKLIKNRYCK